MRLGLMAVLAIAVALAIFNPSMDQFRTFVRERTEVLLLGETGDSAIGRALSGAGASLAGEYVDRITDRDNYFIFSTYTIDLDGEDAHEDEWRFLGIGGQFLELERPDSIE